MSCKNCVFFDPKRLELLVSGVSTGVIDHHGFCRHQSPRLIDREGRARFPIVHEDDWCGVSLKERS